MLAHPAPGHTPVLVCVGETPAEYEPVWPPTLMMNKANRDRRPPPDDHLGRGAARDRPGRARRGRRRAARRDRRPRRARRRLGRPGRRTTRPPSGIANRAATRKAIGVCVEGRDPAAAAALVERRDELAEPLLQRRLMRIAAIETRRLPLPARPAVPRRVGPGAAHAPGRDGRRSSAPTTASRATRAATRLPDRELLERLLVGLDPTDTEASAGALRDRRLPPRPQLDRRGRGLGPRRRAPDEPLWRLLGGARERHAAPTRRAASSSTPDERVARVPSRCATRGVARREAPASTRGDWRADLAGDRSRARGRRRRARDHGRREPGLAHARRPHAALGRRDGDRSSRASSSGSASTGSRSRSRPTTSRATRALRAGAAAASRRARWCARPPRRATSSLRGGVDVVQPDVVLVGRHRRLPARSRRSPSCSGRAGGARTRGRTATGCSRTSTRALARLDVPVSSRCRSTRRPGRRSGATGCSPVPLEIAADGTIAPAARPRARRRARLRRARARTGSADADPRRRPARARRAARDRGGRARRRREADEVLVRVAAAGVCHSDVRLADGDLGDERWPDRHGARGRGRRRGGRRGGRRTSRPGDHVAFCFVPACRACRVLPRGQAATSARPSREHGARGMLHGRHERGSAFPTATPLQHGLSTACFAERTRRRRRRRRAASRRSFRCGRPRCSAAGSSPAFGAVRNVARRPARRVGRGDRLRRRRAAGGRRPRGLPAPSPIIAVDRDAREARAGASRSGATHAVDAPATTTRRAAIHGSPTAASTTRSRWSAGRRRSGWRGTRCGPGGTAVVVGLAPEGVEVDAARDRVPLGQGDPRHVLRIGRRGGGASRARGARAGGRARPGGRRDPRRHLDGIEAALERLRRGEGARTVLVIDPALAGAPKPTDGGIR